MNQPASALHSAFCRVVAKANAAAMPHQSKGRHVRFPGASLAAADLGVTRGHLHRVLTGERSSPPLMSRWKAWLKKHPSFSRIQKP